MRYPKRSQYKYAKSRYRVQNWADYEAGLQTRGALTVWLSDAALEAWRAPATGRPGGQRTYSDLAMEAGHGRTDPPADRQHGVESSRRPSAKTAEEKGLAETPLGG